MNTKRNLSYFWHIIRDGVRLKKRSDLPIPPSSGKMISFRKIVL